MKNRVLTSDYVFDVKRGIWSRPDYVGICYSDGDEAELRIASIIDHASDISVFSPELRQHCVDWPSLYHLSGTRANILRPFAAALTGDVLEIGAGCGAITRYLGECGANTLALEGSPRRAAIARSRTRDLENVTVMAERFDQFQYNHPFDVITLIGVLEYANLFTDGQSPARTMLQRVRSLLKPEGKLIVAIENQLGLKYFAGAPEDHLGQLMYGIEGRYQLDQPQTFGRMVLAGLLEEAGFSTVEFLAPFPDYKLPVSILTTQGLSNKKFDGAALAWQSVRRDPQLPACTNFSLELAWPEVFKNGLALDMANSFLVVASPLQQENARPHVLGYHYSTDRAPRYCKEIVFKHFDEETIVVNYQMLGGKLHDDNEINEIINFTCPQKTNYAQGVPLSWEFVKIVTRDGWSIEEVGAFVRRYINMLSLIANQEGNSAATSLSLLADKLPGHFFDIVPQNIIVDHNGRPVVIDTEWTLKVDIELGWLLFRSLLLMMHSVIYFGRNSMGYHFTRHAFIKSTFNAGGYASTDEDLSRFAKLESVIQQQVSGRVLQDFNWWPEQLLPIYSGVRHDEQIASLNQTLAERDDQIASSCRTIDSLIIDRNSQKLRAEQLREERDNLQRNLKDQNTKTESLNIELSTVYRSKSWRITLPLRKLFRITSAITRYASAGKRHSYTPQATHSPVGELGPVGKIPGGGAPDLVSPVFRILLVSYYCPTRAHAGGLRILDIYALIRQRCPDIQIDLLTHHRPTMDWSLDDVYRLFDHVYLSPVENLTPDSLTALRGSPLAYDVIDLQFHQSGYQMDSFRHIGGKIIFTPMESLAKVLFIELSTKYSMNNKRRLFNSLQLFGIAASLRSAVEEIDFTRKADEVVCVSRAEAAFLRAVTSSRHIRGVDTGVSQFEFADALAPGFTTVKAADRPCNVLYLAYFGSETNVIALHWYLEHVHPLIKASVPDYIFTVIGRGDLSSFFKYRDNSIELVGEVPAIAPRIQQARIGIAPALGGSGFRGKINQYAVLGLPCVVSPIAIKGLAYQDGVNIFIAEAPETFADRCIRLLTDLDLNDRMGQAARQLSLDRYSWQSKWPAIRKIYNLEDVL